jgi:hypothetical protein
MRKLLTLIVILVAAGTSAAQQQVNQAALVDMLSKGSDVAGVVTQVRALGPQNASPELRGALIARLEQLNDRVAEVTRIDQTVDTFIDPETLLDLAQVVAELPDPRAISALTRSPYIQDAVRTLVEFGEQALPAVASALKTPELNNILRELADHPSESHRRGITNAEVPDLVEKTQRRAADGLAGVPAKPDAASFFAPPATK